MTHGPTDRFTVIIPARFSSSRLPGKPLEDIAGKPMIEHVYRRAAQSAAERVIVATDDQRIFDVVKGFGGEVCMTASTHESGTDRLQEVCEKMGLAHNEIVVNVQGDEPLLPTELIDQVAANLQRNVSASCATLSTPVEDLDEMMNPNAVKVVADCYGLALYFSRASIPWPRDAFAAKPAHLPVGNYQRHIGIYAYRVRLLNEFITWPMAPIEQLECLEQLRILWNGHRIHVEQACCSVPGGVDTPDDLARVRAIIEANH